MIVADISVVAAVVVVVVKKRSWSFLVVVVVVITMSSTPVLKSVTAYKRTKCPTTSGMLDYIHQPIMHKTGVFSL